MRNSVLILFLCFVATVCGQTENNKRNVSLLIHNGISITSNPRVADMYKANSYYTFGFGFRFGNPQKSKLIPFIDYDRLKHTSFRVRNDYSTDVTVDTVIAINQITLGVSLPVYTSNMHSVLLHSGFNMGQQIENSIYGKKFFEGYKLGISYESIVRKTMRYYFELDYDVNNAQPDKRNMKVNGRFVANTLQNIDWFRLKIGVIL